MNTLLSGGLVSVIVATSTSAIADDGCMITVVSCACDEHLSGGPGFGVACGSLFCGHQVLTCDEGTMCVPWGSSGKVNCNWSSYGFCHLILYECVQGECRTSFVQHAEYHPFTYATGNTCPYEDA